MKSLLPCTALFEFACPVIRGIAPSSQSVQCSNRDCTKRGRISEKFEPCSSSFGAESEDRVDRGGATSGQIAGEESYRKKKQACRHDRGQVAGRKSKQHAGDETGRGEA